MKPNELLEIEKYLLDREQPNYGLCKKIMNALEIFNRQQAEIENYSRNNRSLTEAVTEMQKALKEQSAKNEKLKNKVEELSEVLSDTIRIRYSEAKAEAIKEFAEELIKRLYLKGDMVEEIDNLVTEMVGDAE